MYTSHCLKWHLLFVNFGRWDISAALLKCVHAALLWLCRQGYCTATRSPLLPVAKELHSSPGLYSQLTVLTLSFTTSFAIAPNHWRVEFLSFLWEHRESRVENLAARAGLMLPTLPLFAVPSRTQPVVR